jgi:hypothetical protein
MQTLIIKYTEITSFIGNAVYGPASSYCYSIAMLFLCHFI